MTRNRERRSFTVAAKSSGHQGFVSIPAKAPRVPQAAARKPLAPSPWAVAPEAVYAAAPAADAGIRRILPSLIAWEAPAPEPEREPISEPPLPRVRRVTPQGTIEDTPRRRGRPRKIHPVEVVAPVIVRKPKPAPAPVLAAPRAEPSPVRPSAKPVQRKDRPESAQLRLGERWKRRLPRSCW